MEPCSQAGLEDFYEVAGVTPIKIFVGTWNLRYQDIPVAYFFNSKVTEDALKRIRATYTSSSSLSDAESTSTHFYCDDKNKSPFLEPIQRVASESGGRIAVPRYIRQSTLIIRRAANNEQPLQDWLKPNYHIYIIALQERLSTSILEAISIYLDEQHDVKFEKLDLDSLKISGRGDGAFLTTKSTGLAIWVRQDCLHPQGCVKLVGTAKVNFGFLKGSKGSVSVAMEIYNQRFCFIGSHLPASGRQDRRSAMEFTVKRLSQCYSGLKGVTLDQIFHHIIWAGDLNTRLHDINIEEALSLLSKQKLKALQRYDEFLSRDRILIRNLVFKEPTITFIPTYKKADGRNPVDFTDCNWAENEYFTTVSVNWYKGGGQAVRIPAWTDRVIRWSKQEARTSLTNIPSSYSSALPSYQNPLITSDHSPVGCGFVFNPSTNTASLSSMQRISSLRTQETFSSSP